MRVWTPLIFCTCLLLSACASSQKIVVPKYDANLPVIEQLQAITSQNAVGFEWKSMYDAPIAGFKVYKALSKDEALKLIASIDDKYITHFVDGKLEPSTRYYYLIKTFNNFKQEATKGASIEIKTKDKIEAIPFIQSLTGLASRVKLIWRPHPDPSVKYYLIQRAAIKDERFKDLAKVENRLSAEYIDKDLKPNESFKYRVFAVSFDEVKSKASIMVKSTTKALPPSIDHLKASTNGANKIIISWDSLAYEDFDYFNIYSKINAYLPERLIAKSVKNSYTDHIMAIDEKRLYAISMVDKDGLESKLSNFVEGKTASLPKPPVIIACVSEAQGIKIEWIKGDDRAVEFTLKRYGNGKDAEFVGLKGNSFIDVTADPSKIYSYELMAVDKDGLISKPSKEMKSSK